MKCPSNTMFTIFSENIPEPDMTDLQFVIFQKEACPTSGRIHLQGYAETKRQLTVKQFTKALRTEVNVSGVERRRGSQQQAIDYCSKEDTRVEGPWQFGERKPYQERDRTDLNAIAQHIAEGASISDVADNFPKQFIQYNRGIRALKNVRQKHRNFKTHVIWIYGSTGVGKSRTVWERFPDGYPKNRSEWWCGYDPDIHEVVVLDDYRPNWKINFDEMLRLFDRYPHLVQQKGSTVTFKPKILALTTIKSPQDTFKFHDEDILQLIRRIDEVINLDEQEVYDSSDDENNISP